VMVGINQIYQDNVKIVKEKELPKMAPKRIAQMKN
jgi:hypothetical protein